MAGYPKCYRLANAKESKKLKFWLFRSYMTYFWKSVSFLFMDSHGILLPCHTFYSTTEMLPWHVNPRPRWQLDQETHSNDAYPIIVNAQ